LTPRLVNTRLPSRPLDYNGNDVPDECEYRGDFDGDTLTALRDLAAYQNCFGAEVPLPVIGVVDGRFFPVSAAPQKQKTRKGETPAFDQFMDAWYPIQVKQADKVGRPDIDAFETAMERTDLTKKLSQNAPAPVPE